MSWRQCLGAVECACSCCRGESRPIRGVYSLEEFPGGEEGAGKGGAGEGGARDEERIRTLRIVRRSTEGVLAVEKTHFA